MELIKLVNFQIGKEPKLLDLKEICKKYPKISTTEALALEKKLEKDHIDWGVIKRDKILLLHKILSEYKYILNTTPQEYNGKFYISYSFYEILNISDIKVSDEHSNLMDLNLAKDTPSFKIASNKGYFISVKGAALFYTHTNKNGKSHKFYCNVYYDKSNKVQSNEQDRNRGYSQFSISDKNIHEFKVFKEIDSIFRRLHSMDKYIKNL